MGLDANVSRLHRLLVIHVQVANVTLSPAICKQLGCLLGLLQWIRRVIDGGSECTAHSLRPPVNTMGCVEYISVRIRGMLAMAYLTGSANALQQPTR